MPSSVARHHELASNAGVRSDHLVHFGHHADPCEHCREEGRNRARRGRGLSFACQGRRVVRPGQSRRGHHAPGGRRGSHVRGRGAPRARLRHAAEHPAASSSASTESSLSQLRLARLTDVAEPAALVNFRNFASLRLEPQPGVLLFCGRNGQGKTNLLESVYVLATTRSPRTSVERELLSWRTPEDADLAAVVTPFARLEARVRRLGRRHPPRADLRRRAAARRRRLHRVGAVTPRASKSTACPRAPRAWSANCPWCTSRRATSSWQAGRLRSAPVPEPGQFAGIAQPPAGLAALQPRPAAAQPGAAPGPRTPPAGERARAVDRADARLGCAGAARSG